MADKIPTQKSKPVNAYYLHHWKPTTKVRIKHGSKRGQELKAPLSLQSSMILILAAGLDSVGKQINACVIFDPVYRNGF